MKCCSKCLLEKELDQFHRWTKQPDGLHPECKACKKERNANRKFKKYRGKRRKRNLKTYLITDGTAYKIGSTVNIKDRLAKLQTGNPRQLELIGMLAGDYEFKLQDLFVRFWIRDEWFTLAPEIKDMFIQQLAEAA